MADRPPTFDSQHHPPDAGDSSRLQDRPAQVAIAEHHCLAQAWRDYDHFQFTFSGADGESITHTRDVLRVGRVVGVLPVDPDRDVVVLIRQFRLPGHLATGRGDMVEIVAGMVEDGEEPAHAAERECREEIGVAPKLLVPLFPFMPAPGLVEEIAYLFLAIVDSSGVPDRAGAQHEAEYVQPLCVPTDVALKSVATGAFVNGYCIIALQWLALNRHRLGEIIAAGG